MYIICLHVNGEVGLGQVEDSQRLFSPYIFCSPICPGSVYFYIWSGYIYSLLYLYFGDHLVAGCSARCSTKDDWPTTGPFWLQDGVITRLNFVPSRPSWENAWGGLEATRCSVLIWFLSGCFSICLFDLHQGCLQAILLWPLWTFVTDADLACFPCFVCMQLELRLLRMDLSTWTGCSPPRLEQSKMKEVAGGVLRVSDLWFHLIYFSLREDWWKRNGTVQFHVQACSESYYNCVYNYVLIL